MYLTVLPPGADREVTSAPAVGIFTTRPLPPSDFRIEENKIVLSRSLTGRVRWDHSDVMVMLTLHLSIYFAAEVTG